MKRFSKALIALILAIVIATLLPVQVVADTPEYISEIKIAMDDTEDLNGYIILKDGNNPADINKGAGGGEGSQGNVPVYLGYKTTKNRKDAITDLAVMNMKGGYSTEDYDALMETQLKSQIIPFVQNFMTAIYEYRQNYKSNNKKNNERAHYIHKMLNLYTDDDTGKQLGDLFLNETKLEMGDEAYDKLSNEEKKNHADILTIVAQANGQATFAIENLLTRASDTNTNTWIDRFKETTYEDLIKATGKSPTDARKEVAKLYDDNAQLILDKWEEFNSDLKNYNVALKDVKTYSDDGLDDLKDEVEAIDKNSTDEEIDEVAQKLTDAQENLAKAVKDAQTVDVYEKLKNIPYGEGTMLDFFLQEKEVIEEDITVLYPISASITDGQKAGLDFISLKDLVLIAVTEPEDYKKVDYSNAKSTSIYAGVNRDYYKKGGVGLTNDALRKDAIEKSVNPGDPHISGLVIAFIVISSVLVTATLASAITSGIYKIKQVLANARGDAARHLEVSIKAYTQGLLSANVSKVFGYIAKGFGVAAVLVTVFSVFLYFRDLENFYKVKFTPVPLYMVDEKDLIGYNAKGEKIILKNQSAYYTAVHCNRTEIVSKYDEIGTVADLNGDAGSQWLALYTAKNEMEEPILADSLKVVVNDKQLPAGYTTGIHMFGTDTAFNLNTYPFDWNKEAPPVYVYFKRETSLKKNTAGANFSAGIIALAGGTGVVLGAAFSSFCFVLTKKRRDNKATAGS